jgi:hypothetical protein
MVLRMPMTKIANGTDIVAAAIKWRNAEEDYFRAAHRNPFGDETRTRLREAERKAWREFITLLDTRPEVKK